MKFFTSFIGWMATVVIFCAVRERHKLATQDTIRNDRKWRIEVNVTTDITFVIKASEDNFWVLQLDERSKIIRVTDIGGGILFVSR